MVKYYYVRSLYTVVKEKYIMGKQKTKLGARILSKEEMNAILPNAESIDEQIEVFRESLPYGSQKQGDKQGDKQFETEQKTNNIGIIGRRGAGKTSILKTFYHKLKNENAEDDKKGGDIILPIIVPENMSSGTTLMDTILGRLKSIVEEKMKEDKKKKYVGDCIYVGKNSLEWMYNELVKQYCYIKKDYRDILIQQFTTEQNYVDKTKKVFSSDSEFITMFNQFVTRLLQGDENTQSMMFLFIDDVDLSTNKCMDIVRTLLVYLSNPRIVTFISGDIQTFEEELTLEFLRQEDALREDAFRETYYSVNHNSESSLLERKKQLAYEYLKKIIPPAYRRAIQYWDLDERGNYKITGNEGDEPKSLVELLVEVTKEKLGEMYFVYKEDNKTENMRLAFHMFDDTSRGLNNVYNVLQEIYDLQISDLQKKEKNMTKAEKELLHWRLIETMIDSKPLYAKYKSDLLKHVIVLGQGRVKVDFANAYQLLYGKTEEIEKENKESMKSVERFAVYYLIDFAAKLFSEKTYDNEDKSKYSELKRKIILEYLQSEEIDGKIPVEWKLLDFLEIEKTIKEKDSVKSILLNILTKCDFIFVLHMIRCLGRAEIYAILEKKYSYSDKENAYKTAYAFSRAVQALNESEDGIQDYLTDLYIQMQEVMLNLLNTLSLDPWVVYGRRLVDNAYIEDGMRFMGRGGNLAEESFMNVENYMNEGGELEAHLKYLLWAKYENEKERYWIYYERKLREKQDIKMQFSFDSKENVLTGVIKTIMNQMKELNVVDNYEVKPLKSVDYDSPFPGKDRKWEKRKPVLEEIDEQGLWDTTYAKEKIKLCQERSKHDIIHKMCSGRMIFNATHFFKSEEGAYSELKNCYKGTSGTALVYGIESKVRRVMSLSKEDDKSEQMEFSNGQFYLSLEQVLVIQCILEEFLHFHNRVVYGKKEVRKLLMEMKELPLALHTSGLDKIHSELKERENAFFEKNLDYLRNQDAERFDEKNGSENSEIEQVRERYYEQNKENDVMEKFIKEYLGKTGEDNEMYIKYLVQKAQIKEKKEEIERRLEEEKKEERKKQEGKKVRGWDYFEPKLQEKEGIFIFQSYLRYLQANESEAKKAGARAEDIVKLAKYMLDSEIKADERIQNEVYQIISKKIDITENEFEVLF